MTRSVLIICEQFPPDPRVGGLRAAMFAKYLPEFGWKPYVLTRSRGEVAGEGAMTFKGLPPDEDIFRVPHTFEQEKQAGQGRSWREAPRRVVFPEAFYPAGLLARMTPALWDVLGRVRVDAILATSPLDVPLRLADMARRARGIPWVADFRDIVEQDMDREDGLRQRWSRRVWRLRRGRLLRTASAVTAVSKHHAAVLAAQIRRPVEFLPNGFDPELCSAKPPRELPQFRIVYTGRIINTYYRDPRPLFQALDRFLEEPGVDPARVEILFYGAERSLVGELVAPHACRRVVRALDRLGYEDVAGVLAASGLLLLLTNRERQGILTTKVFEYLAARRPILCVQGDNGELDELLAETGGGVSVADPEAILAQLLGWYREWRACGTVEWGGREEEINKYSRREQARNLAGILDRITRNPGAST